MTKKPLEIAARLALWLAIKALRLALSQASPEISVILSQSAAVAESHWLPAFKARTAETPSRVDDHLAKGAGKLLRVLKGARR